jgi:hypothetical protein
MTTPKETDQGAALRRQRAFELGSDPAIIAAARASHAQVRAVLGARPPASSVTARTIAADALEAARVRAADLAVQQEAERERRQAEREETRAVAKRLNKAMDIKRAGLSDDDHGRGSHARELNLESKGLVATREKLSRTPEMLEREYYDLRLAVMQDWNVNLPTLIEAGRSIQAGVDEEVARVMGVSVPSLPRDRWK